MVCLKESELMNVQFKCWYWKSNEIQVLKYRNHSNQAGIVIYWQEHIQHVQPKKQEKRFKCTGIIKKPHWKCDKFRKHIMEFPLPKFERCEYFAHCFMLLSYVWFDHCHNLIYENTDNLWSCIQGHAAGTLS